MDQNVPGWEGSQGPFPPEYGDPHVYARDVQSGAGNCVCGAGLDDALHVQAAPGVDMPLRMLGKAAAAEQRYVLGVAYQAGPDPRIQRGADGGRDWFAPEDLERAAWGFLQKGAQVGLFHGPDSTIGAATVVESYIWRGDPWDLGNGTVVRKGDWLIGAILNETAWQHFKSGRITGWSPQGTARRRAAPS